MTNQTTLTSDQFEFLPKSRQKAEEIAGEKIFGWQPFSAEQIEKAREPIRKTLTEFGANVLAGPSGLVNLGLNIFGAPKKVSQLFPTPESFKKNIEQWTGESLKPENFWEDVAQDVAGRAGTMAGLGGARSTLSGLGVPIAGTTVKKGLEYLNVPDWMKTSGVLLTDMFLGSRGLASPTETARAFHREAGQLIPRGHWHDATQLENDLTHMITNLERGGHNPETAPVLAKAREIVQYLTNNNGQIDPHELYAFRTSINALRGHPETLEGGRRWFDAMNHWVNRELTNYGNTQNPQFLHALRYGDQIVQGLSNARRATNFLRSKVPTDLRNPVTWIAFGLNPKTWLTGLGLTKSAEVLHQIIRSPGMRRYYGNAIRYALEGDAKASVHELHKFDKEADKNFPEMTEGEFEFMPKK